MNARIDQNCQMRARRRKIAAEWLECRKAISLCHAGSLYGAAVILRDGLTKIARVWNMARRSTPRIEPGRQPEHGRTTPADFGAQVRTVSSSYCGDSARVPRTPAPTRV